MVISDSVHQDRIVELQAELETTRAAFHRLLAEIPPSAWQQKGVGSAWTVREEMWHICWGMRFMLDLIKNAHRGIGLPRPPMLFADRLNVLYTRLRARSATRRSIADRYDKTHQAVLDTLSSLRAEEWEILVRVFGQEQTIAYLFHGISHHFHEHAARIRPLLA